MRLSFIALVLLILVLIGCDCHIARLIPKGKWRCGWMAFAIAMILYLCVTVGLIISESIEINTVMWLLYVFMTIAIPLILFSLVSLIGFLWPRKNREIRYRFNFCGLIIAIIVFMAMWTGTLFERRHLQVNEVEIASAKIPEAFDGYRIVQFSDAHVGTWGSDTIFISKLVKRINALKPDMIVFTGDLVSMNTHEAEPFLNILGRLNARGGVYSVLGNHDYGDYSKWPDDKAHKENNRLLARWQQDMGWDLLNNTHRIIRNGSDSIILIGVENWGEPPFSIYGDLNKAYSPDTTQVLNQMDDNFKILLSHNPEHWNKIVSKQSNIDLTLSGHTHAMQMMLKFGNWKWSPAKWKYDQWGGLYTREAPDGSQSRIYVNIGCGEVGIPGRYGARPEITVLELKRKND